MTKRRDQVKPDQVKPDLTANTLKLQFDDKHETHAHNFLNC